MTIRNLEHLFKPSSIAIISQGQATPALDTILIRNLMRGGFKGPIMPVNPQRQALEGVLTYKNIASLPLTPDLALLTTPLAAAPALIDELGARGTRAVVVYNDEVLSAQTETSWPLRQAMLDAAKPYLLRILGPDNLGIAAPRFQLNATLSPTSLKSGHIALISQSGAVTRSVLDWAKNRNIGFSHLVSLGEKIDVDFGDLLDYFARDAQARAILLYIESIHDGRKFMSAARAAARIKPVVALKPRNYSLDAVDDAIYDAAFRRAGILRVNRIEHLFNAAETLDTIKPVYNNHLAIVGNSHSIGLLASDALLAADGQLATLNDTTRTELRQIVPRSPHLDNPVDLDDNATPEDYGRALKVLLNDSSAGAVLVLHAPSNIQNALDYARAVVENAEGSRKLVMTSWIGAATAEPARQLFKAHNIGTYNNPGDAAQVFVRTYQYLRYKDLLMETPPSVPEDFTPDSATARKVIANALARGRKRLTALEAAEVLAAYRIPIAPGRFAIDPPAAALASSELGGAVALKVLSPDIVDKSEIGAVAFGLSGAAQTYQAATRMLEQVRQLSPEAIIDGFIVQPMLARAGAYEVTIGVRSGAHFGPVIRFGHGGTETRVIDDLAYALPPLNMQLAYELISRTRISKSLGGSQARRADVDALALTLIKVAQLVIDCGEITELDINPLWLNGEGIVALDARIVIDEFHGDPAKRLAIQAYPKELEQDLPLADGRKLLLRPILPEDEPTLQAMVKRQPAEDLRLRFFQPIRELPHAMAARLTQLDYRREMAFAVTERGRPGQAPLYGVVRFTADPDMEKAEYAILVDRAMTGLGLGPMMMRRIIDYARSRGIKEIFGEVLRENESMLKLNRALGFTVKPDPDDNALMRVSLAL